MNLQQRLHFALARPRLWMARLSLYLSGVKYGRRLQALGVPITSIVPGACIRIGDDVSLLSSSQFTALGVNHPVVLRAMKPGAQIVIGNHVGISGGTICAEISVSIGDWSMLGANVTLADTDFHPIAARDRRYSEEGVAAAPIKIGERVFIGTGAIVLKGVTVGPNSVIGAGSVVTKDIPENCIAAGNPCRVLKQLLPEAADKSL
jgi:acetyltransferase-like isoleucine patch superfamily enzyme